MNMVSGFIGTISPEMFGGNNQSATQNINLKDTTFSDMLEKQINEEMTQNKPNLTNSIGIQSGIDIGNFDGVSPKFDINTAINNYEDSFESVKPVKEFDNSAFYNPNNTQDKSASEVVTFFKSVFDTKPTMTDTANSGLFTYERKIAADSYGRYAKNIITDINEFVSDALKNHKTD